MPHFVFNELVAARLDVCSLIGNEMVDPTVMWRLHSTVVCVALSWPTNLDRKIPLPNTWLVSGELSITKKKRKKKKKVKGQARRFSHFIAISVAQSKQCDVEMRYTRHPRTFAGFLIYGFSPCEVIEIIVCGSEYRLLCLQDTPVHCHVYAEESST